jgi:hypothetical protein
MEADLQNLRSFLEEESDSRKGLAEELHAVTREIQETIDKRMDRALSDCREDRDLRLAHLADRIEAVQHQGQEARTLNMRMKIAVFSAICAFAVSIVNAMISLLAHK